MSSQFLWLNVLYVLAKLKYFQITYCNNYSTPMIFINEIYFLDDLKFIILQVSCIKLNLLMNLSTLSYYILQ